MYNLKYLSLLIFFGACHGNSETQQPALSKEPLDTVHITALANYPKPSIFEKAFIKGTKDRIDKMDVGFYGVNVGNLKVPTGRLVACDPFLTEEYGLAFTQAFPTGEFPVQLAIAHDEGRESIVFVRILFSEAPVVRWEYALLKNEKPAPIGAGTQKGFIVDSGIAAFMDSAAAKTINTADTLLVGKKLYQPLDDNRRPGWRYANFKVGDQNLVAFSPAFDGGYYRSYIGYDASGVPCRLLTDLGFKWDLSK